MRRIRLATGALRQLDQRVGRLIGPVQVLVDVRTPMNLAVLRPVWRGLSRDPRVRLTFTAHHPPTVAAALEREHHPRLVTRSRARWRRFDLAISADFWSDAAVRRCRRRINFFHGVAGKYDLDNPAMLAGADLNRFDRVAFVNEERRDRYVAAGVLSADRAALVGFPKLDDLLNGRWRAPEVRRALGLDPSLPTLLYAPTFSTASSLHLAGEGLVEALLSTGANVIVKLHDRSLEPSRQYTDGIDWPARLARFREERRFVLARDADASPYLAAADILVTDHSTVGFEFAMLDRPIVVFDAPALKAAARIDDRKWQLLRGMADVATDRPSLIAAVEQASAAPGRLREARRAAHHLFAFPGAATDRALTLVYELLELDPLPAYEVLGRHRYA